VRALLCLDYVIEPFVYLAFLTTDIGIFAPIVGGRTSCDEHLATTAA
jgi:hypothetical protein